MRVLRKKLLRNTTAVLFLFTSGIALSSLAADSNQKAWQAYDESADIAELAEHENNRMRFKRLNSRLRDKNILWNPFREQLEAFTAAEYSRLKPLILNKSIVELQQAIRDGLFDYESLTTFYIYRIREIETDDELFINAVISLNPDAISRARALDELRRQGAEVAVDSVFGIPLLLKDNIGFDKLPTTAGAVALENNFTGNAFVTDRLLENGAVILGKANLSEWAYFFCQQCPSGYSALGGQTLNPYGRKQFGTGGSSSGSGAAVAANFAPLAVGSETSGSILSPASANSVVGLKPTTGSLSRSGVVPISATLDTTGPMARNVADVVSLFNAMAGYDQADLAMPLLSENLVLEYRLQLLSGKRLGIIEGFADNFHYQQAAELLANNGASLIGINFNQAAFDGFSELLGAEMVRDLALYLSETAGEAVLIKSIADLQQFNALDLNARAPYGQALVDMMAELNLSASDLEQLREELQNSASNQLDALFAEFNLDVLLSINNRNAGLAALANYPALTIPMGYEENGRPIGLTLIAPSFQEQRLIDVGAKYEQLSRARRSPAGYQ